MTSPSDTSLVERLRARTFSRWESDVQAVVDYEDELSAEAADRIEALEAERNALIRSTGEHITVRSEYLSRAETAEARNRELEAGLEKPGEGGQCNSLEREHVDDG